MSVVICRASSLSSDNLPLYVVDRVPLNHTLSKMSSPGNGNAVLYSITISDFSAVDNGRLLF